MTVGISEILLGYVAPSLGCLMASIMFAAPVQDLRQCLSKGQLGSLNPFPWVMMTGNCLGWVVYGYYKNDAFVVAGNLPGLVLSLWLNSGASKLQYLELYNQKRTIHGEERFPQQDQHADEAWDASIPFDDQDDELENPELLPSGSSISSSNPSNLRQRRGRRRRSSIVGSIAYHDSDEYLVMVPQERSLLRILSAWCAVIVWAGWFSSVDPATTVGMVVNGNLVFFYGAPLQSVWTVLNNKNSSTIHLPTMIMSCTNTSFWIMYGLIRWDFVIVLPNIVGLSLGIMQALLCMIFPHTTTATSNSVGNTPRDEDEDNHPDLGDDHQAIRPLPIPA